VSWANSRGGSGVASGTTSWSTPSIAVQPGINVITVTALDAAGNAAGAVLTVTYNTAPTLATVVDHVNTVGTLSRCNSSAATRIVMRSLTPRSGFRRVLRCRRPV